MQYTQEREDNQRSFFQFSLGVDTENYLLPSISEGIQRFSNSPLLISHYCRMTHNVPIIVLSS